VATTSVWCSCLPCPFRASLRAPQRRMDKRKVRQVGPLPFWVGRGRFSASARLQMDPFRGDGRRCLDPDEIDPVGFVKNGRGR
jgi:hypothetical protein